MTTIITLEISEQIERDARAIAERSHRRVEDVLAEWLNDYAAELPVANLPDERVLELAETQMPDGEQAELSDLMAKNREGLLTEDNRSRFDQLMQAYRRGMVRKAEALKVAVERGLLPNV